MTTRTGRSKKGKQPKPPRVSATHEFFPPTIVYGVVVSAFAYYGEWIGIVAVTCIYIAWQQSILAHLPGPAGETARTFLASSAGRAWLVLLMATLVICTIASLAVR